MTDPLPPSLAPALSASAAILFTGSDAHSVKAQHDFQALHDAGAISFVHCDAGDAEVCAKAGVRTTPTLVVGGERVEGWAGGAAGAAALSALLDAPGPVAAALGARNAVLYGREACVWTRRQKAVLGQHIGVISYVDCAEAPARCAGITGVPTLELDAAGGGRVKFPGFKPLAGLRALVKQG